MRTARERSSLLPEPLYWVVRSVWGFGVLLLFRGAGGFLDSTDLDVGYGVSVCMLATP